MSIVVARVIMSSCPLWQSYRREIGGGHRRGQEQTRTNHPNPHNTQEHSNNKSPLDNTSKAGLQFTYLGR